MNCQCQISEEGEIGEKRGFQDTWELGKGAEETEQRDKSNITPSHNLIRVDCHDLLSSWVDGDGMQSRDGHGKVLKS